MICITGATGHIGGGVARILASRGAKQRLIAREPTRLPRIAGAETARARYEDRDSLNAAFEGASVALVVSGNAAEGVRARLHMNAIDAAIEAGVRHVVYLSFQGASPLSAFPMARDHFLTEQHLAARGVSHTALRDNLYLDSLLEMFDSSGAVRGPAGEGRAAWVCRDDVVELAAAILLEPSLGGGALDVTGPEAVGFSEAAERLSALAGRPLRYVDETLEEAKRWRQESGASDWEVDTWIGSYLAMAAGELEDTSPTIERVLGRKPQSIEDYLAKHPDLLAGLRGDERNTTR